MTSALMALFQPLPWLPCDPWLPFLLLLPTEVVGLAAPHVLLLHQSPWREVQMGQGAIMTALYQARFLFPRPPLLGKGGANHEKGFLWRETASVGERVI